jgi:putative oxygen-independent coproporphyrinogen III oxidase
MTEAADFISLYVHWPFCEKKCPYCDFNSHVRQNVDAKRFERALLRELEWFARRAGAKTLTSVFFGGGTPSLMPSETVKAVLERAFEIWNPGPDIEITLEANPGSSEAKKFKAFEQAGVNRLSLGVQSLREDALKFLGRIHGVVEAKAAIEMARDTFPRFSFDLIYARPGQSASAWGKELEESLALAGSHLSLYQLTLELDTAFFRQAARGELTLPDPDTAADLFELTRALCADAGLPPYEISNFARPGYESRHNLGYWRGRAYAGIGPGAHSRLKGGGWRALSTIRSPEAWRSAVEAKGSGIETDAGLTHQERGEEMVMTSLRLAEGLSRRAFAAEIGADPASFLNATAWQGICAEGLAEESETHLRLTERGFAVLDRILSELLNPPQGRARKLSAAGETTLNPVRPI